MKNFYKKNYLHKQGVSLFEFIIYIAIVSTILIFVVNILLVSSETLKEAKISKEIRASANVIITRVVNEVRKASIINTTSSIFDNDTGRIVLNIAGGGSSTEVQIFLDSGKVRIYKGGVDIGNLSSENIFVDSLVFRNIDNGNSNAIKLEMTIKDSQINSKKSENFYTTVVLRGSYAN